MFPINEYVMHRSEGVCVVEDIRTERFPGTAPRQYYILRPVYGNTATTVFLPVDSGDARLRALLTRQQIEALPVAAASLPALWVDSDRQRQETFNHLLKEGDPATLLKLLTELWEHQKRQTEQGKKLRFFDEKTLQELGRLIGQEYAHVLNTEPERVLTRLRTELNTQTV